MFNLHHLCSTRRFRRLAICRLLACTISLYLLCALLFPASAYPQPESEQQRLRRIRRDTQVPFGLPAQIVNPVHAVPTDHSGHDRTAEHFRSPFKAGATTTIHGFAKVRNQSGESLAQEIEQLATLLPDTELMTNQLSPLKSSGEHLLRDLAYRVRSFRSTFAKWEQLHLKSNGHSLFQRNVISELQQAGLDGQQLRNTIQSYDRFRSYMSRFASLLFPWTMKYSPDHMSLHASFYNAGRGMVMTAGDRLVPYLLTSIPSFRQLGCELPIEVLYLGDDDLSEHSRAALEELPGVITRDLSLMIDDAGWTLKGWAAKPFAILMSSFREVIFIDADALFFTNPEVLFNDTAYRDTGALFFKDRNLFPESKQAWLESILPSPISNHVKQNRMWTGESGHMQESGVVVVDKWRHFIPLLLTTRLNGPDRDGDQAIGKKGVYDMVFGDKETFWLSWELAGDHQYVFHDTPVGTMGKLEHDQKTICSPQLLHFDRHGEPLWFNGWIAVKKEQGTHLTEFTSFDVYMREPEELGYAPKDSAWTVLESNVVCLRGTNPVQFTQKESDVLDMIIRKAKNVAMLGYV